MKNPMIFYAVIGVGVLALIVGAIFMAGVFGHHPARGYAGIGLGVGLIVAGIIGMVISKPKAIAAK